MNKSQAVFIIVCGALGADASPVFGQTVDQNPNATATGQSENSDQVIKMSALEVTTTQGTGYVADNSARGMKTDQPLLDIPQADIVVTADFISDVGYYNSSDILRYVGVASEYRGEALSQRGVRDANSYLDDMQDPSEGYQDSSFIDSYDVIKGPAAVLYQNASLSGVIVKSTKKPLPYEEASITESIQQWGQSRTVVDYNKPLGQIGDTKFTFRFVGAVQVGDLYWQNYTDHRLVMHPMLAINYKNNTLRIAYDFENIFIPPEPQGVMTLNGKLWTGWGRDFDGLPPGDSSTVINQHQAIRLEWLNKISESWENRFQAEYSNLEYFGSFIESVENVDWVHYTEQYFAVLYSLPTQIWQTMDDLKGHLDLGPIQIQSTTGFATSDEVDGSIANTNVNFGTNDTTTVSLYSRQAVDAMAIPPLSAYMQQANPGQRFKTLIDNVYEQEEIDAFDNRLALVEGFTFETIEAIEDTNTAFNAPYSATDTSATHIIHRLGAVLKLVKDLSLYALTSTNFSPGVGTDYADNRLPDVRGQGNEVGIKTAFFDGRVSSQFAVFHEALTNQVILGAGENPEGVGYYIPIGSTTLKGVDGDIALSVVPGWQVIATGYVGSVTDQNGNRALDSTYDNSWSLFTRYDFKAAVGPGGGWLSGLAIGAGVNRIGSYYLNTGAFTVIPSGYNEPNPVKFHEGTPIDAFIDYRFNKHWSANLGAENLLDQAYVVSSQSDTTVDASPPFQMTLTVKYKF